ncbi:MAG: WD40 repeat domain-containing protein, partial [Verrucomicrobiae bacterium]|nr:WD40 repeat domain-containing protein [Verrucomicrobiae bacterium]
WDGAFSDPQLQAFIRAVAMRLGKPARVSAATAAELNAKPSLGPYPTGPLRTLSGHGEPVSALAISPDGHIVLSGGGRSANGGDTALRVWDVTTRTIVRTLGGPGNGHTGYVTSIAFAPDGRTAVSAASDATILLWDIETGAMLRQFAGHSDSVSSVAFAPDGGTVISGSWDKSIALWNVATGHRQLISPQPSRVVQAVAVTPDGKHIAVGHGGIVWSEGADVVLVDITNGQTVRTFQHVEGVSCLAISPDGGTLLAGGGGVFDGTDFSLHHWEISTGDLIRRLSWHQEAVRSVAFSPDGRTALSSGGDKRLVLWDLASGRIKRTYCVPGHPCATGLVFRPDGRSALSGCDDGTIREWDTTVPDRTTGHATE